MNDGAGYVMALAQSGEMFRKFCQVGQSSPVEPVEIDVVGMAHCDGHLMPWLPAAKQLCFGVFDGGDTGSW